MVGVRKDDKGIDDRQDRNRLSDEQFHDLKKRLDNLTALEMPKEYEVDKALEADVWVVPESGGRNCG